MRSNPQEDEEKKTFTRKRTRTCNDKTNELSPGPERTKQEQELRTSKGNSKPYELSPGPEWTKKHENENATAKMQPRTKENVPRSCFLSMTQSNTLSATLAKTTIHTYDATI